MIWAALLAVCLLAYVVLQCYWINAKRDNGRAIAAEAERRARENTAPLGNVSRWIEQ